MTNQPLFSVLIANYNNGKYLMDAIESVRRQTYTNWEIILVDDSSTDNSHELYKELEQDERIHIFLNDQNHGCGYTKRRCAELANGDLCGFLDPDDALTENALELETKIHVKHIEVSVVYSKVYFCDSKYNVVLEGKLPTFKEGETYFDHRTHGAMNFASYKTSYYRKTEGINPNLKAGVDQDLYFKIEEVGEVYLLDEFTYRYVIEGHANAISTNFNNYAKLWYWNLIARRDTCIRRGIDEGVLVEDLRKIIEDYKNVLCYKKELEIRSSLAYRLGKTIIAPFSVVRRLYKRSK